MVSQCSNAGSWVPTCIRATAQEARHNRDVGLGGRGSCQCPPYSWQGLIVDDVSSPEGVGGGDADVKGIVLPGRHTLHPGEVLSRSANEC